MRDYIVGGFLLNEMLYSAICRQLMCFYWMPNSHCLCVPRQWRRSGRWTSDTLNYPERNQRCVCVRVSVGRYSGLWLYTFPHLSLLPVLHSLLPHTPLLPSSSMLNYTCACTCADTNTWVNGNFNHFGTLHTVHAYLLQLRPLGKL